MPKPSCPHCAAPLRARARFCGNCGLYLRLWDLTWSLRRAVGGAIAAGAGWVVALGFSRLVFPQLDLNQPQPLVFGLTGIFLGAAGGLMEKSPRLALRGMLVGSAAGFLLGAFFRIFIPTDLFWAYVLIWAGTGSLLGFFCGRIKPLETVGGLFWGGLGGALSLNFSVAMTMEYLEPGWQSARGVEFLTGAVLGAFLWGGAALTGRFGIRQRWTALSPQAEGE